MLAPNLLLPQKKPQPILRTLWPTSVEASPGVLRASCSSLAEVLGSASRERSESSAPDAAGSSSPCL